MLNKLKITRQMNGLTQHALGKKLGVSGQLCSWWETGRGEPNRDQMVDIARIFNVDPSYLWPDKFDAVRGVDEGERLPAEKNKKTLTYD